MMRATVRQRLHWLALHGVIRSLASFGAKRGEMQGRLIADLTVRADPGGFADELRARGRLVRGRAAWLTADHALAHQLLRSDDFAVTSIGSTLPNPLGWIESKTAVKGRLHPLLPPSLLSVEPPEHTRYRKTVSSVFTTRAVAALRERVQQAAAALIDDIGGGTVDVVDRYCSQLPVTVIGDIIGVPDDERPRILEFGELAAPSLDIGLPWEQYLRVERGLDGFNEWLANHIHRLRERPRRRPDEPAHRRQRGRDAAQRRRTAGHCGPGARRGLRDHREPARQRNPHPVANTPTNSPDCSTNPTCGRARSRRSCGWSRRCS